MKTYTVNVRCEHWHSAGERCSESSPTAHVHLPWPCENGKDDRHHDYLPPRIVHLDIAGRTKYVRLTGAKS